MSFIALWKPSRFFLFRKMDKAAIFVASRSEQMVVFNLNRLYLLLLTFLLGLLFRLFALYCISSFDRAAIFSHITFLAAVIAVFFKLLFRRLSFLLLLAPISMPCGAGREIHYIGVLPAPVVACEYWFPWLFLYQTPKVIVQSCDHVN